MWEISQGSIRWGPRSHGGVVSGGGKAASPCPPGLPLNTDCPWVESVSVVVSPGGHNRAPHQARCMAERLCHGPTGRGSQIRGTAQPHSGQCPFPHAAEAAQTLLSLAPLLSRSHLLSHS